MVKIATYQMALGGRAYFWLVQLFSPIKQRGGKDR